MDAYQKIIDILSRCKRVLITTHVRPDGDALGTSAALSLGLRNRGIESEVLLLSHVPSKYVFIFKDYGIVHHDVEKGWEEVTGFRVGGSGGNASLNSEPGAPSPFFQRFDALIVADTGTWSQLPGLRERIENWKVPKIVIDHHLTQEEWADAKLVITEAAAAGEIAFELLEQWDIPLDAQIATALYLAIATDTGWFQFSNTRPFTHRLAATLMEAGADTDRMYQLVYQNERAERVALQTLAMQSLELLSDGRLAVMSITKEDFARTRAGVPATENLINIPLQIATVEVSVLLVEPPEGGPIRVSLRSKGQVDVANFAEQFGGGGHARAAGAKVEGTIEHAEQRVVSAMQKQIERRR
jgi:phosphoesterase RecJ-like protein